MKKQSTLGDRVKEIVSRFRARVVIKEGKCEEDELGDSSRDDLGKAGKHGV